MCLLLIISLPASTSQGADYRIELLDEAAPKDIVGPKFGGLLSPKGV